MKISTQHYVVNKRDVLQMRKLEEEILTWEEKSGKKPRERIENFYGFLKTSLFICWGMS